MNAEGPAPGGLRASITLPMAFCVSLKQVIGGGVIVLTGTAIAMTGAGASIAYLLACIVVLLVSLPYAVLGAARPVSGSLYRWPARFIHPAAGFMAFWLVLSTHVGLAAYAATFGATLHALLPVFPARLSGLAALVAAGIAPGAGGGARTLNEVATQVMNPWQLALFGICAGIVSMLGIMNTHMLWGSRSTLMVCQDGWLPVRFGRPNRAGAPVWPLLLLGAIGAVPVLAGLDVASIIRVSALGASASAMLSVACAPLNAWRDPQAYAASPLPVPMPVLLCVSLAAIGAQAAIVVLLLRDLSWRLILLWAGWVLIGALIAAGRHGTARLAFAAPEWQ